MLKTIDGEIHPEDPVGAIRESFFANQTRNAGLMLQAVRKEDFIVEGKYLFEIGGKSKSQRQISGEKQGYIVKDRIEFFNPGKLAEGLTVDRLLSGDYTSTIRNKQIASVLKDAGIIERYGSGIKRILESFSVYGLGRPIFEEFQEGFRVTVFRTTQKTTQKFSTKEHILRLLKENPRLPGLSLPLHLGKARIQ